jgi:hypothetical protein
MSSISQMTVAAMSVTSVMSVPTSILTATPTLMGESLCYHPQAAN